MRRSTTVVDGAIGGMLAGAVVAAWFFALWFLCTIFDFHPRDGLAVRREVRT